MDCPRGPGTRWAVAVEVVCSVSHVGEQGFMNVQRLWPGSWHRGRCACTGWGVVLGGGLLGRLSSEPHPAQVVCATGRGDRPLRHQNSLPRTLEVVLAQCGLGEEAQVAVFRRRVKAAAEAALAAVLDLEAGLSAQQRGGRLAGTDFLGECQPSGPGAGVGREGGKGGWSKARGGPR